MYIYLNIYNIILQSFLIAISKYIWKIKILYSRITSYRRKNLKLYFKIIITANCEAILLNIKIQSLFV